MMQEVRVHLWDDVDMAEAGQRTESAEQVELRFKRDGREVAVRLDLTGDHAAELEGQLARWLKAGTAIDAPPVFRYGFKPGSKEARDWRRDLRQWADDEGRTSEYINPNVEGSKNRYRYPDQLVKDYEAHLLSKAKAA
jgi:Lsr2